MCDGGHHDSNSPQKPRGRPRPGNVISNWNSYEASFGTKLRLALRNAWIRVYRRSDCCGNDGQPGC